MRVVGTALVLYPPGTITTAQRTSFAASAEPEDMEQKIAAALAARTAELPSLVMSFGNLAGAGYGHIFIYEMYFVDGAVVPFATGILPKDLRIFIYMAADAVEIDKARTKASVRAAAALAAEQAIAPDTTYTLLQTHLAGAAQGTRFMGALVFATEVPIVP